MVSDDIIGMTPKSCKYLLPIGNWGAGWGPLCLDVSIPEEEDDPEDGDTWTICWIGISLDIMKTYEEQEREAPDYSRFME